MNKEFIKYIEDKFQVTITNTTYIKDKDLYLLSDVFIFIIASKKLSIKDLILEFSTYKTTINLIWKTMQTKTKNLKSNTKINKVFTKIVANLKGTINKPIITQEATGKNLDFNWLAYTDSSQIKE